MGLFSTSNQVGLYVDAQTICVVNVEHVGQTTKILGSSEVKMENALEGSSISEVLERSKVTSKNISLAVPGEGSMVRHFKLPMLPKKEERNAVRYEAQKYVPFDMKELYYDYEIYRNLEKGRANVVFFACKKQWVDTVTTKLQATGSKISRVELVSQSVARAFYREASKGAEEVCAILVANSEQTAELIIQKKGSVLTTQHLVLSESSATPQLSIPSLVSDIRICLDYFNDNFKMLKVNRFYLAVPFPGDTKGLLQVLRSEFLVPADAGKLFQEVVATGTASTSASTAAYGLTLSASEARGSRGINLKAAEASSGTPSATLNWEEEKKQLRDLATTEILVFAALTVIVYFLLSGVLSAQKAELQKAIAKYPQTKNASISEPIEALETKGMEVQRRIAFYSQLIDKRVYFTAKMSSLAKLIPPNIQLQQLTYADDISARGSSVVSLRIHGIVRSSGDESELTLLNKLVARLTDDKDFMAGMDEIKIVSTQRTAIESVPAMRFALDCLTKKA